MVLKGLRLGGKGDGGAGMWKEKAIEACWLVFLIVLVWLVLRHGTM
jgi:hypothetical protein